MSESLIAALHEHDELFGISLSETDAQLLSEYYELVGENNALLHLVAPCPPEEFATRHILESLTMLKHLPLGSSFVDLGSGGGVPAIPCLLVRNDLRAQLIESKEKKGKFLEVAVEKLNLSDRATVISKQFGEASPGDAEFVTCRAIERFTERLPKILNWSRPRPFLFFGGPSLSGELDRLKVRYSETLMPLSRQRYLFASKK